MDRDLNGENWINSISTNSQDILPLDQAFSGYDGANYSTRRGKVYWPTLDSRRELDSFSRAELVRRVRWLYANVGLVKRLIKGLAELVGYQSPQAITTDPEWNEAAEKIFANRTGAKKIFDRSGKFNFSTAQLMLTRSWLKDGDILTVMTNTQALSAQFAFYEGPQLVSPRKKKEENWQDGVKTNLAGLHVAYGIDQGRKKDPLVVKAKDCIYHGEFDSVNHNRAVPPLAQAVNHVLDITEIWGDVKTAIKINSLSGVVRTQTGVNGGEFKGRDGLVGGVKRTTDSSGKVIQSEEIYGGGQVQRLAPGEDLKIVSDPRPEQSQRNQISDLIRDIAWGVGLAPEVVWHMDGLNGPGVRFVMDLTARWIEARQMEQKPWCNTVWLRTIATEMANGNLRQCEDPEWWKVKFRPQRSMTIDRGREGAQREKEIRGGMGTLADWYKEVDGADWQDKVRQRVQEVKFAYEECGGKWDDLSDIERFNKVFPPQQGAAHEAAEEPDDSKEKEKKEPKKTA